MSIEDMKSEFQKRFEDYVHPRVMDAMLTAFESIMRQAEPELLRRALPKKKEHRHDCYFHIGRECNCGAGDYNQAITDCLKEVV